MDVDTSNVRTAMEPVLHSFNSTSILNTALNFEFVHFWGSITFFGVLPTGWYFT